MRSKSVILTALADLTRKITEILRDSKKKGKKEKETTLTTETEQWIIIRMDEWRKEEEHSGCAMVVVEASK